MLKTLFVLALAGCAIHASQFPPLGKRPVIRRPIQPDVNLNYASNFLNFGFKPRKSDLAFNLRFHTPPKDQGNREVCSIFSSIAALESLIAYYWHVLPDLSENYMEYLVISPLEKVGEGSNVEWNFPELNDHGMIFESVWPYEPSDWVPDRIAKDQRKLRKRRCRRLQGDDQKKCRLTHRNPHYDPFVSMADKFKQRFDLGKLFYDEIYEQSRAKEIILSGRPLILGVEFFYGAWNHDLMEEYGLGKLDPKAWETGVVGTPTQKDIEISRKHESGHSVVVVGFDDERQGYIFKNSWGPDFGWNNKLLGDESVGGYGIISYEYAHKYGILYEVNYYE